MTRKLYAALEFPTLDGRTVALPIAPASARRMSLLFARAHDPAPSEALKQLSPLWLLAEPGLLLWATCQANSAEPRLATLQAWLTSNEWLYYLPRHVCLREFERHTIDELCEQSFGTSVSGQSPATDHTDLDALLLHFEPWLSASESESPQSGSTILEQVLPAAQVQRIRSRAAERVTIEFDWLSAWSKDMAWNVTLVTLCEHQLALRLMTESFEQRLEQEKLRSMKQLAYGASHEINNPLANIATRAQTLMTDESNPRRRRTLATINQQAFRAHEMIADMMLFAMPPDMELAQVSLQRLLEEVVDGTKELAQQNDVKIILDVSEEVVVEADEAQLLVALRCICLNAVEAMPTGGVVSIGLRPDDLPQPYNAAPSQQDLAKTSRPAAVITIRDDGPGLSSDVRRHLFDPFFSGREAGRGLGFGLSKAWRIVTELGGRILVNSPATGGTEFAVWLPQEPSLFEAQNHIGCGKTAAPLT